MSLLAPTLQAFFTERLVRQRQASPQTVATYRDALRLLVGSPPSRPAKHPRNSTSPIWTRPSSPAF